MQLISKSITTNPLKGTLEYIPPEYISDPRKRKSEKFDVYSFAILVWEIFSQKRAYYDFCDRSVIHVAVVKGNRPLLEDIVDEINDTVVKMIKDCWYQNVGLRPTFKYIRQLVYDGNAPIQNKIKKSLISLEQQRKKHVRTVTMGSQEQKPQYPDSGVSVDSSIEQKPVQTLGTE